MKLLLPFLLLASVACAQTSPVKPNRQAIRRDSTLPRSGPAPMPINRPENDFYRHPNDPSNVVRASLDNMPVKVPDTTVEYTILSDGRYVPRRNEIPVQPRLRPGPMPKLPKKEKP